nr:PKD domain-containing protein [Bacteroidota bacterium]
MKKLLQTTLVVALMLFGFQSLKAFDFNVDGQVSMMEQQVPAPEIMVKLCIPVAGIFETTLTGEDGTYNFTVEIEEGAQLTYFVKVFDFCIGEYIIRTGDVTPDGAVEDFLICEDYIPGCEAAFDYWQMFCNPMEVHFWDESDFLPGTWFWEFGDGETSDEQNPQHLYAEGGEYEVTLTIISADLTCNETVTEIVYVEEIVFGCEAAFTYFIPWHNPMEVHFHDQSDFQPGTWFWEFGDGETSGEKNPFHTYATGGEYEVSLTIMSDDSTCVDTYTEIVVIEEIVFGCEAAFEYFMPMFNPMTVHFIDQSDFQPGTWFWEFGDGETSGEPNPFHTYTAGGEYEVSLTIMSDDSTCVDTYTEVVEIEEIVFGCEAAFEYFLPWFNPMEVHFWDQSDFQPGTWFWEFGDGETSNEQNPQHIYAEGGEYEVSLTIISADSTCIETATDIVVIEDMTLTCQANFWWHHNFQSGDPLEIEFINNSYAYSPIVEFAWDFGDGTTSNEENPIHLFADFGTYDVSLAITTESGCTSDVTLEVWVHDWSQNCMAMFVPYIDSINPVQVYFQDMSIGPITEWLWEFGDGEVSFEQNPTHIYPEQAVYEASLTIQAGQCTSSFYYEINLITGQVVVSPGPTTGVNEQIAQELTLYPNPV